VILCIDVGNTHVTLGLFRKEQLAHHWRVATNPERTSDEYGLLLRGLLEQSGVDAAEIGGVSLASVVPPLTGVWVDASVRFLKRSPLVVDAGIRTGVKIRYDDPRQVGADRVVDAAAVARLYGGPACIVDFGTATTFDAVSAEGDYLGGAIAPGLGVALEALCARTAKLPRVEIARPPAVIGKNTVQSMQSGVLFGYVALVEGMVARFRDELGPEMKVIGTGGYVELIAKETQVFTALSPTLTLEGLRIIYELNRT
jgi:type III pantothenate kinase